MSSGDAFVGNGEFRSGSFENQHEIIASEEHDQATRIAPSVGPIAIAPKQSEIFTRAVSIAGGQLEELNDSTRGLVWLSNSRAEALSEALTANPQLSWVQLPWAGVDAFSDVLRRHARPDLIFTSAKGCFAQPVAEHALMLALALLRYVPRRARATSWDSTFLGISLYQKNVVIVGAGGIARELIRLLEPFSTHITIVRRSSVAVPGAHETVTTDRLSDVLPSADVVVLAAASTRETRHLIGATELAVMKPAAALVNIARGALVDSTALVAALSEGHLVGAATDVTDPEPLPDGDPLWVAPNMLITPHMADTPEMTGPLLAERVRRNVSAFVASRPLEGVVDATLGY